MPVVRHLVLVALILSLAGCSGGGADKKTVAAKGKAGAAGAPAASPPPPTVDVNTGLDLDSNRVRAFSPSGWRRAPKSYDYLVRYTSTPQLAYRSVIIVGADPPEGFQEVTKENHEGFVAAIASRLAQDFGVDGKPPLLRRPAAVSAGSHHAVTWSAPGEAKLDNIPKKIERECTAVVVNGRLYTVEAWAPSGKMDDKAKAAARAVATALAVPSLDEVAPLFPSPAEPAAVPETVAPKPEAPKPEAAKP